MSREPPFKLEARRIGGVRGEREYEEHRGRKVRHARRRTVAPSAEDTSKGEAIRHCASAPERTGSRVPLRLRETRSQPRHVWFADGRIEKMLHMLKVHRIGPVRRSNSENNQVEHWLYVHRYILLYITILSIGGSKSLSVSRGKSK